MAVKLTKKVKQEIKRLYNHGYSIWELAHIYQLSEAKVVEVVHGRI
jgi:Mor family transcriptional regulator